MKQDVPALAEIIDREHIDILHAHMENAHLLAALARRRSTRKPALVVSHYNVEGPKRSLRTTILHRKATDACILITNQARRNTLSRFPIPPACAEIIGPGIDLDRFDPGRTVEEAFPRSIPEQAFVIGMVTRIRSDRRVDLAISALELLKDRNPHVHLLIVGHGEEEEALRGQVKRAGIEDRVTWAGYCRGDQLVLAYRAMDLLFYPIPGTDQSCRTVREAMAAGVPVLASRTGFLTSLVEEEKTGYFTSLNAEDLADKLDALVTDLSLIHI